MSTHKKTLIIIFGVVLGIVIGEKSLYASEVAIASIVLAGVQAILTLVESRKSKAESEESQFEGITLSLVVLLFCVGVFVGVIRSQLVEEKMNYVCEKACTFEARIISSPETKNDYQVFNVHPNDTSETALDVLVRTALYPKYKIGDTLKLTGKVITPNVIMPHAGSRTFDYVSFLNTKNIGSEMTYPKVETIDKEAHSVRDYLGRWKEDLIARGDMYITSPASLLSSGMLFGVSSIGNDLAQTFRTAGLSHIVVLSGFNIAIVIASILFVLTFFPLFLRIILAICSVIIFVMMVGAEASVVRATLMAFIGLLALATGREYVARQALLLSFIVIIYYSPSSLLHDVSLHLSFLATAGIVYLGNPLGIFLAKYFPNITSTPLHELSITTVSAYVATLPYVMYTFGTISVYALLANILVLPFIPVAMLLSFLVVVSSYVSRILALSFGYMDTILLNFIIWIARAIELLPFSTFQLTISLIEMIGMYVTVFISVWYFLTKNKDETHVTHEDGVLTDIISY